VISATRFLTELLTEDLAMSLCLAQKDCPLAVPLRRLPRFRARVRGRPRGWCSNAWCPWVHVCVASSGGFLHCVSVAVDRTALAVAVMHGIDHILFS
jgi:hypothetical protein